MRNKLWPALSLGLFFGVFNIILFICLERHLGFLSFFVSIFLNIVILPILSIFLEQSGWREKAWNYWSIEIKSYIHKSISAICVFWIFFFTIKCLYPLSKEMYVDKNPQ